VGFLVRRLLSSVVILIALAFATFMLVRLIPGDPALILAGPDATSEQLAKIRHDLGIDLPFGVQLVTYLTDLVHGDLGTSFASGEPVVSLISQRGLPSLELAAVALVTVLTVSVPVGMVLGALTRDGRHKIGEVVFTGVSSVAGSLPEFLAATFLAFVFAVWLRILPVAGDEGWQNLVLPVLAVTIRPIATLSRIIRAATLNALAQDYIRTARSKQLPELLIYVRHVLPNVLTATLTIGGLLFANLVGGALVVENVFARAGLGTALVNAILAHDYPTIQGTILLLGFVVVAVNTVVDLALAVIDPRSLARQV
jgi:peptide/nickel transport system permease protein